MKFLFMSLSCFYKIYSSLPFYNVLDATLRIFVMFNLSYFKHRQFTFCASVFEKFLCLKLKMIFWYGCQLDIWEKFCDGRRLVGGGLCRL